MRSEWTTIKKMMWLRFLKAASFIIHTVTGTSPLVLENAVAAAIKSLTQYGKCTQASTPTPDAPVDIVCNNGVLRMVDDELPSGYTRLTYVESQGTGYIDTGIVLNTADLDVEIDFQTNGDTSGQPKMAWGYMGNTASLPRWGIGTFQGAWLGSPNTTAPRSTADNDRHTIVGRVFQTASNYYFNGTIDGTLLYSSTSLDNASLFLDNTLSVYLFARNNGGTAGNNFTGKIYGFKVTKADVVIHELIPCKNASNEIGFYDLKTDTFKGGTGTLVAGNADYSHTQLSVVGTPEVLTVSAISSIQSANIVDAKGLDSRTGAAVSNSDRCHTRLGYYSAGATIVQRATDNKLGGYLYMYSSDTPSTESFIGVESMSTAVEVDGWYERSATSTSDGYLFIQSLANKSASLGINWSATQPSQTVTDIPTLLSAGDYADTVDIISGGVVRKCGIHIFDGNETISLITNKFYYQENLRLQGLQRIMCSHFPYENPIVSDNAVATASSNSRNIIFSYGAATSVAEFKDFLRTQYATGTPVIVIFPLAEETEETVTPHPLTTAVGTNTLSWNYPGSTKTAEYAYQEPTNKVGTAKVGTAKAG